MGRKKAAPVVGKLDGVYFPASESGVRCIPTGCVLLDCVLGGGWARGRIANIVGDQSVGKTLLAIEACANFALLEPKGKIFYREAEAAFDESYAEELGLPVDRVDFGSEGLGTAWDTIEDIFEDLDKCLGECVEAGVPGLYIVDSLDALTSRAELGRKPGEASFGLEKQKLLGQLFRQLTRRVSGTDVCVIIISQVRDKIGVVFGEKQTRSGGKALGFFSSQVLWLSYLQKLTQVSGGIKRAVAIRIKALCKKNKIGPPFRECEFTIRFGYGIEDVESSLGWLQEVKMLDAVGLKEKDVAGIIARSYELTGEEREAFLLDLRKKVIASWKAVESRFVPKRRKYA